MKNLFALMISLISLATVSAQELVVDPVTSAAIAVSASSINSRLNTTNNKLGLIQKGQMAVSSQLLIANDLQNKIYKGLSEVSSVINNISTTKEIADCGIDIVNDVAQAAALAKSDPVLLLFAQQAATDFQLRAAKLAADVAAFVLKGGADNLMDAGERGKLLNHIANELRILRGIAYGMERAMYWARANGIFRTLNPWAAWQSQDQRIANEVLTKAKYLKR